MPFKSQAQRRMMYATKPSLAKRFEKETPKGKLPERVGGRLSTMYAKMKGKS